MSKGLVKNKALKTNARPAGKTQVKRKDTASKAVKQLAVLPVKTKQKQANNNARGAVPYYMSPHHSMNIPAVMRCGQAFPYTGNAKLEMAQAIGETIIIACTNPGSAGTIALIGRQIGVAAPSYSVATISTLSLSDEAGGPTSARPMKFGVSLTCTTPLLNRGTRVYHLNGQSRIRIDTPPSSLSLAVFNAIVGVVTAMPTTIPYDNAHFGETQEFTANVVDNIRYLDFEPFEGTLNIDQIAAHMMIWPGLSAGLRDRPMSTTWLIFAPPPIAQNYSVSFLSSYYTRWGLSTIQGQSQSDIPVAPASTVNKMLEHNERMSNITHTIMDVGQRVGNAIGPYLMNRAGQYAAGQLALGM